MPRHAPDHVTDLFIIGGGHPRAGHDLGAPVDGVAGGHWVVTLRDAETGAETTRRARMLVNAAGRWVGEIIRGTLRLNTAADVRLVRGSHIVTRRLFGHDKADFLQGTDRRIIFAIPYETDFTLIGTTDDEHPDVDLRPEITDAETEYLLEFASQYFKDPVTRDDFVWTDSGVRPLYDDGARSATAATRDYVLKVEKAGGAPLLNVFGGKITTYRRLAEAAPLPGGDFPVKGAPRLVAALREGYPFLTGRWAWRLVRAYGTEAREIPGPAASAADLGEDLGATLSEAEVRWLMEREFARRAEDVVSRRSRLGLRLTPDRIETVDRWMRAHRRLAAAAAE